MDKKEDFKADNNNLKKEIIDIVLNELIRRKIIKKGNSIFDNTKELLKSYNKLKYSKKGIQKQIKNLVNSKDSLDMKASLSSSLAFDKEIDVKKNLDTINLRILDLEQEIIKIDCFIDFIDNVLNKIKDNPDYELIERVYLQNENPKDIAIEKECDDATIYRKINRLVDEIKILLFPGKFVDEIS